MNICVSKELVSPCGLYCGACHRHKKGKCPGCVKNEKASWCKVRSCVSEKGIATCAACDEYDDVMDCKTFNTFFAKMFSFIFKSDRKASLERIRVVGPLKYAREMAFKDKSVLEKDSRF